jgi:NitT/TauT family transport system permease protein
MGGAAIMLTCLKRLLNHLYGLLSVFVFLALWEIAPRTGLVDPAFLPPFSRVVVAFWNLLVSGELIGDALISAQRALFGFGLGIVIAIPLGLALGGLKALERIADPLLQIFRQTSALALFPVFMLFLGIGEVSKVAIIFWGVLWPILLNTIAGVKNVDPLLVKAARAMGTSPSTLFLKVVLPGAFPSIFTGVRLSATYAILMLIAAEMLGANSGLGYLLNESNLNFQIPNLYAAIIALALLGLAINYLLLGIEGRTMRWREDVAFK